MRGDTVCCTTARGVSRAAQELTRRSACCAMHGTRQCADIHSTRGGRYKYKQVGGSPGPWARVGGMHSGSQTAAEEAPEPQERSRLGPSERCMMGTRNSHPTAPLSQAQRHCAAGAPASHAGRSSRLMGIDGGRGRPVRSGRRQSLSNFDQILSTTCPREKAFKDGQARSKKRAR